MKKLNLILTILIGLSILSCSSDDNDNTQTETELIIGIWKPVSELQVVDGVQETDSYTCGEVTSFTFLQNGNYTFTSFQQDDNNDCIEQNEYIISGTWEKLQANQYKLTTNFENINTSEIQTEIETKEITFSGNNSMTIFNDFDPSDDFYNISVTFERIE